VAARQAQRRIFVTLQPALETLANGVVSAFTRLVEEDNPASAFPELLSTEELVRAFSAEVARRMLQALVDTRLSQAKASRSRCACQKPLELLQETEWKHGSHFGEINVKDVYTYCRICRVSARPLHAWIGTGVERWSLLVQEDVVDLASDESCQKAVSKLTRMHPGIHVGRTTALRMLHEHGSRAREFVADKLAGALATAAKEGRRSGVAELEVEYDGGMVPVATLEAIPLEEGKAPELTAVRGLPKRHKRCRWEEVKLGLVQTPGEVEGRLYTARPTGELDEAFQDLLGLACLKGWTEQTSVRGIADGARHIRPRLADVFHASPFRFILDRPHAKEHLAAAGTELESLLGQSSAEWAAEALDKLEAGSAMAVVEQLRAAGQSSGNDTLRLEADYFERNQDAVAYQEYRLRGWSTASSEVESGHRSVVQIRLKLPGTWWHPDNVPNILALRMLKANGWWSEYWAAQRRTWRLRADQLKAANTANPTAHAA
jgi:hypothetical protein